jgi:hypothetical protein
VRRREGRMRREHRRPEVDGYRLRKADFRLK